MMSVRFPNAVQLVYDIYNILMIGFGPTNRASDAIFSLAAYRGGVSLCFLHRAPELPDPKSILRGSAARPVLSKAQAGQEPAYRAMIRLVSSSSRQPAVAPPSMLRF